MFKTISALALCLPLLTSIAQASPTTPKGAPSSPVQGKIFACLDDNGGTYTARNGDGSLTCENGSCAVPAIKNLSQLTQVSDESIGKQKSEDMFFELKVVLTGTQANPAATDTTTFFQSKSLNNLGVTTTILCSLPMSQFEYDNQFVQEHLQFHLLN